VQTADERRESSSSRGYNQAWADYAAALRMEHVFCELCLEACGIETPIAGQIKLASGRMRSQGVVDHIAPVHGADDPLFWVSENHWCLCQECDAFKSLEFDGRYGKQKRVVNDRTAMGIERRRAEVIEARRKAGHDQ
jgi:5-methylcytosine-specific restriction endonuclease McrA